MPGAPSRPHVVVHVAVSLDGASTGFDPALGPFYALAARWSEDVTLTGADTILAQEAALATATGPGPAQGGPLLAVVDSRARVRRWRALRDAGHWRGVLAVSTGTTPVRRGEQPDDEWVLGEDRLDLSALLTELVRRVPARVVRVDSGGGLTGALLTAGLVDEVSLLVHPVLAGSGGRRWAGAAPSSSGLALEEVEPLDGGLVWARYRAHR